MLLFTCPKVLVTINFSCEFRILTCMEASNRRPIGYQRSKYRIERVNVTPLSDFNALVVARQGALSCRAVTEGSGTNVVFATGH